VSRREVSLAIIGAGPAGLAAATQAAKFGVDTVLLDLHEQAGGHFFSLPPAELQSTQPDIDQKEGETLIEKAKQAGVEALSGAEIWGIYAENPFRICFSGSDQKEIWSDKIILAPGAIERIWPFPGWTLPGVMTAGGALTLLKNQKCLPGKKILISGTGPLQLALAARLAAHGAEVVALLELQTLRSLLRNWPHLWTLLSQTQRMQEGLSYFKTLRASKIPYRFGWSVVRAFGEKEVTGAVIAQVDKAGKPIPDSEKRIEVDCICLGYGLLPDTSFTRLLECDHEIHPHLRAWVPVRDEWLQTSIPGIFAIGDAAGINGKDAAILEGKIAALAVAHQLGRLQNDRMIEMIGEIIRNLKAERRFARLLDRAFQLPNEPCLLADAETVICRCECVTFGQVEEAIRDGATSVQAVKYLSRAGMGWCRGTHCAPVISQMVAQMGGIDLEEASQACIRPPFFPITIEQALDLERRN